MCLDSNRGRGEQLPGPTSKASKPRPAGVKRKRASTRYSSNKDLPSWKSDQPTGFFRAPAKPVVQPQRAAPSAEPALQVIHGDSEWMQGRGPRALTTLGWLMTVKGKPKPHGHWTDKALRITPRCPLAGLKADMVANQGSVRETTVLGNGVVHRVLPPKGPERRYKRCLWLYVEHRRETNKKAQKRRLGINVNLTYEDVSHSYKLGYNRG